MQENESISLKPMDKALLHEYYKGFAMDADIFMDMSSFHEYTYSAERVEAHFAKIQARKNQLNFLIMKGKKPIGELALKNIDIVLKQCELSIHLQNDAVKNKGYGTQAERLAIAYAFQTLKMEAVLANAVRKNKRSQHVLEKVGFKKLGQDDMFVYYRLNKTYD